MADSYEIDLEIQGGEQPALVMETEGGATDGASARNAEAWAAGTRNGVPVEEGDPAYHNNSKYYRDSAAAIAAGDVIDDDAGIGDYDLTWSANKLTGEFGGTQENMTAGNALFLLSDRGETDKAPYTFRKTGGSKSAYGREMLKKVVGGTVAWNQLSKTSYIESSVTRDGITFTNNNDGTVTVSGTAEANVTFRLIGSTGWKPNKYVLYGCPSGGSRNTYSIIMSGHGDSKYDTGNGAIWNASGNTWKGMYISIASGTVISQPIVFTPQIIDLTMLFGSTIADAIYAMEQATAGSGVAWFKKLFPKNYYAYDAGILMSVNAAAHKTVGFNLWDKTNIENGYIDDSDGIAKGLSAGYKHTGYVEVIPGETYYIKSEQTNSAWGAWYDGGKNYLSSLTTYPNTTKTAPANARYMRLTIVSPNSGNADTVCINLSDTAKNGTYEPYQLRSYPLANVELRGVPKLDSGNNLYYDGDEYEADGTVTRRYAVGNLLQGIGWNYNATKRCWTIDSGSQATVKGRIKIPASGSEKVNCIINGYETLTSNQFYNGSDETLPPKAFSIGSTGSGYFRDTSIESTAYNGCKTVCDALVGLYELATPTTESADPYRELQISNRNGTEEFTDRAEKAGTRDVAIPVGTETFYPVDVFALIDSLQALILENISNS